MNGAAHFRYLAWFFILLFAFATNTASRSMAAPSSPATVAEAAGVLNLASLPIVEGAERPGHQNLAGLFYKAPGAVKEVYEFHRKQLLGQKWTESSTGYVTDQMASATFTRDGFWLSVAVFPTDKPGMASVSITQHGNVELDKLPVPPEAKPLYSGPVSLAYVTDVPVPQTAETCRKLLMVAGWEPYGTAGEVLFFKQQAVRLTARVAVAPAQGGKTVIDYSTVLMSVDLPAPAETEQLQYADVTTNLSFFTTMPQSSIASFYRETLGKSGWQATTDKPFKIGFKEMLIFHNPEQDMVTLEMFDREGKNRVSIKHQSAAAVAELDRQLNAEAERKKADAQKRRSLPRLAVALPAEAREVHQTKSRIEFKLPAGKAKAAVESWRAQYLRDGWKEDVAALENMAGSVSLSRGSQSLTITYTDTGFVPTEVTLQVHGVELE